MANICIYKNIYIYTYTCYHNYCAHINIIYIYICIIHISSAKLNKKSIWPVWVQKRALGQHQLKTWNIETSVERLAKALMMSFCWTHSLFPLSIRSVAKANSNPTAATWTRPCWISTVRRRLNCNLANCAAMNEMVVWSNVWVFLYQHDVHDNTASSPKMGLDVFFLLKSSIPKMKHTKRSRWLISDLVQLG